MLRHDNRLTSARYELSLIEKRILYFIIKDVRKKYKLSSGIQETLFKDFVLFVPLPDLAKEVWDAKHSSEVKKSLVSLRKRSFEYQNEHAGDLMLDEWYECGFINYAIFSKGKVEIQISKILLPFFLEFKEYTEYSFVVAMSLRSKWSQRMYELCCKWRSAGGFRISVEDLRKQFLLEDKYKMYAAFNEFVLKVAYKELKDLYKKGESDLYFEYDDQEGKKGRSVNMLRFKLILRDSVNLPNTEDLLRRTLIILQELFEVTKKKKNADKIALVISKLQKNPNLIPQIYKRITEILASGISEPIVLITHVLNEDVLKHVEKPVEKEKVLKSEENDSNISVMGQISNLANNKTV